MLKRTLIAVAVVALLATSAAQALGPEPHTGTLDKYQGIKVDPIKMDVLWPFTEYKALDLCVIPLKMEIGLLVQIEECNKRKIVLKQVECGDIGKNAQGDWPCYKGCETIKVRANFDMKLGLKKDATSNVIDTNRWSAFFTDGDTVAAGVGFVSHEICVTAWRARLYNTVASGKAGDEVDVGTITVTVKPNV